MTNFAEPFVSCFGNGAIPDDMKTFLLISRFDGPGNILVNIRRSGSAELAWVVDHDGKFYRFISLGLAPATFWQRLGLYRQQERYRIEGPRSLTVGEFQELARSLKDQFAEAPFSRFLRSTLKKIDPDRTVDRAIMVAIMGE